MTRAELRAAIARAGAFADIVAAGDFGDVLREEMSDHIRDVYHRLELAAGDDFPLAALLEGVGLSEFATPVTTVIGTFGRLWKLSSDEDESDFVSAHRAHLGPLLLFELAHEGAATPAMRRIACLGGLQGDLERWVRRLESCVPSPAERGGS